MKKVIIVFSVLLCMVGLSSVMVKANDSIILNDLCVNVVTTQDYCPKGYICEATNCYAIGYGDASGKDITGISVYKNDSGEVIAYVPNHGHLRCYWSSAGATGWHFDANGGCYVIKGYDRR